MRASSTSTSWAARSVSTTDATALSKPRATSRGGTAKRGATKQQVSTTSLRTAIGARDSGFQDATAASALAYHTALPTLLAPTNRLSTAAVSAVTNEGIKQVVVMGGQLTVSNGVVAQLESMGVDVFRVAGADATDTSQQLARFELAGTKAKGRQWAATAGVLLARGNFYTDADAGSDLAAKSASPIVLTEDQTTVGTYVTAFFTSVGAGDFITMPRQPTTRWSSWAAAWPSPRARSPRWRAPSRRAPPRKPHPAGPKTSQKEKGGPKGPPFSAGPAHGAAP